MENAEADIVADQRDQPRRRGRRRIEVNPEVESYMRSTMVRFTGIINERDRYQARVQEVLARVNLLETERNDMMANFERVNANCQASNLTRNARFDAVI